MEENKLIELLKESVSPFQCVKACKDRLLEAGFLELSYEDSWNLKKGGRYMVDHHGSTLFAFSIGDLYEVGDMIRLAAAHTDSPCFRIKPNPDFVTNGYAQVNVEVYGGPILHTWLDRPLGVAGRVAIRSRDLFKPKMVLYHSSKSLFTIPSLAIHMNPDVNQGVAINAQTDLMPLFALVPEEQKQMDYFISFLAKELNVRKEDILDFELYLYCKEEPVLMGANQEMISSPRLDNISSVSAMISSMIEGKRKNGINLIALFDHEEVGSRSKQGAGAIFLHDMLCRILANMGAKDEEIEQSLYQAMMLSIDVAHALHPNKREKADITNQPVFGAGFCLKEACAQTYATDAEAVAILCQICDANKIPYQRFVNRSDIRGGGTLGAVAASFLPMKMVDIGVPILAMHSAREVMGMTDVFALKNALTAFFEC